jgi:hypothetical protein
VDGFDQDEAESKRDERAVIVRRLLASKCDTLDAGRTCGLTGASTASRSPLFFIALRMALGDLIISGAASRAL